MRIDAYNAISQVYQTNKQTACNRNKNVKDTSDRIEFSETAKTYQTAKTAVDTAPDIREPIFIRERIRWHILRL